MFQFLCRFAFLSTVCLSNRTPKITRILTLYQANAPRRVQFFFIKQTPRLIIFDKHNLQTFKHNTLINKVLLMQFYLFNICPKFNCITGSYENYAHTVPNIPNFTSSLLMLLFVQPLSGNSLINCQAL